MTNPDQDDDCVSKKPWGGVLSRSLKLFTFNAANEGGKSLGRLVFYIVLAVMLVLVATFIIDSVTGWFSGWFDFWPFNKAQEVAPDADKPGWFGWQSNKADDVAPVIEASNVETKWYCKWNPVC